MSKDIVTQLIDNAALLLALSIIFNFGYILPSRFKKYTSVINGCFIGLIGIAVMARPFELTHGVVFDTRSIILAVTALVFGAVPAIIATVITSLYRIYEGGVGVWAGISLIVVCAGIGLLWRQFLKYKLKFRWLNLYLFGCVTHIAMLACMFLLPWPLSVQALKDVGPTVMLIYPVGTVFMSLLLLHQGQYNEAMIQAVEAKERYKIIFNNNFTIMMIIDPDGGNIVDANPAACSFYGWPLKIMRTMKISDINTLEPERIKYEMDKLILHEKSYFLFQHRKALGEIADVEIYSSPIKLEGQTMIFSIIHDISERKRMESEKTEIEAQLRNHQKLEAIGTLAGGVAHEINNPINGIMNYAQLILDSLEEDAQNTQNAEYAREIVHETERVSTIVKNLLQYSRQDKQSHSYAKTEDIINNTLSLINTIIIKDQISLNINIEEGLPDIKCRSNQIQQVLMNLFTNARDALNEKYPGYHEDKVIYVSCKQHINEDRRWILITVEDHGNGIPKELQEKIYEPFFSTKSKDKGTGLGMSISFGIVKEHHGKLTFDTKEGAYTRFYLDLPIDNGWTMEGDNSL